MASDLYDHYAFPVPEDARYSGMSLRDWLAGQALASGLDTGARDSELRKWFPNRNGVTPEEIIAARAYAIADAMLERREK